MPNLEQTNAASPAAIAETGATDRAAAFDAQRFIVWILFLFSGACGLIYEVLWCRQLGLIFGNTVQSMSAVLTAFMAGLALGSFVAGRLCHRIKRPLLVYGVFEVAIGLYCAVLPWVLSDQGPLVPLYRSLYGETGSGSLVVARFAISFVLLLIPTILMGATLPVLAQFLVRSNQFLGRTVGRLYAVNTFGAVIGAAATGFLLLPELGKLHTNWLAVACNLLLGTLAIAFGRRAVEPAFLSAGTEAGPTTQPLETSPAALKATVLIFGVTGFAAMATQIGWTRALTLATGSSTYAFSLIVAVFILGLALGGMWGARIAPKAADAVAMLSQVLLGIGLLCLFLVLLLGYGPLLFFLLLAWGSTSSWSFLLALQALAIAVLILGPTFLMGATLPLTMQVASRHSVNAGRTVGTLYAVNTVGAILGSALGGLVLLPLFQIQSTLELMALCYAVPGIVLFALSASRRDRSAFGMTLLLTVGLLGLALLLPRWDPLTMCSGSYLLRDAGAVAAARELRFSEAFRRDASQELRYYREGASSSVAVVQTDNNLSLRVGGKPDASSHGDLTTQIGLTLIPGLLHATGPEEVLVIGLGSGVSAGSALALDTVKRVDVVEMSPEVVEASWHFQPFNKLQYSDSDPRWIQTPGVEVLVNDGRNHLLLTSRQYDLIASEPSNPWMAGVGNLFTREAFRLAKARLKPGGLMCQWIHSYSLTEADFLSVAGTFAEVFPHALLWVTQTCDFLLIGSERPFSFPVKDLHARLRQPRVADWLKQVHLEKLPAFLSGFIVSGQVLGRSAAGQPVHTDDNMLLEFSAPRALYNRGDNFRSTRYESLPDLFLNYEGLAADERGAFVRELDLAVAGREHVRLADEGVAPGDPQMARAARLFPRQLAVLRAEARKAIERARTLAQTGEREPPKPDPRKAAEVLETALQAGEYSVDLKRAAEAAYVALAEACLRDGKAEDALAAVSKIQLEANCGAARLFRARALALKGQLQEAHRESQEAATAGAYPVACAEVGAKALWDLGQIDDALRIAEAILSAREARTDRNTAKLWKTRAELLIKKERLDIAFNTLEVAIRLAPFDAENYELKAGILLKQSRIEEALFNLRRRTHMDPADSRKTRELIGAVLNHLGTAGELGRETVLAWLCLSRRLSHEICEVEPEQAANWETLCRSFLSLAKHADAEFNRQQAARAFQKMRDLAGADASKLPADLVKTLEPGK